jgi:hypothetical protein
MSEVQTPPAPRGTGPAPTTILAGAIVIFFGAIWAVVIAFVAVLLMTALFGGHSNVQTFGQSIALVFAPLLLVVLFFFLVMGLLMVFMGQRILKRGNGARWTAIILFAIFVLSSLGGSRSGAQNTAGGRIGAAIFFGLVPVLLLLPPTISDFRAARERRQAAHMMPPPAAGAPPPP